MRKVFLIRHGIPEFPNGEKLCIGRLDLPLSDQGRFQAAILGIYFSNIPLSGVFTSQLQRALQTAGSIRSAPNVIKDLGELFMGEWEGLAFKEIKARYPAIYALRGKNPSLCCPPGAEDAMSALRRFESALYSLIESSSGNIAIVSHAGVIRLLMSSLQANNFTHLFDIPQPYGCVNILCHDGAKLSPDKIGALPNPELNEESCIELLKMAQVPTPIIEHSRAVADFAHELAARLNRVGFGLDINLIVNSALLHDIARTGKHHADTGALWLRQAGYEDIARIIGRHHNLPVAPDSITEDEIVFYADKRILSTKLVTLQERFAASSRKAISENAKRAHSTQLAQSIAIHEKLLAIWHTAHHRIDPNTKSK